jgi:CheY-like chemotaxis protein
LKRILVVDDEPTILAAVATRLRAEEFLVATAVDGPSAVATAAATEPDLVVLDVMLPGFDGLEVCRRIQAVRSTPVLMLTARSDETDMLVGLGIGADDYLTKHRSACANSSPASACCCAAWIAQAMRRHYRSATTESTCSPPGSPCGRGLPEELQECALYRLEDPNAWYEFNLSRSRAPRDGALPTDDCAEYWDDDYARP